MRPASTLGLQPSFGFGDRIGLATPGHAAAMRTAGAGFAPIFAQQSIREMVRTQRQPEDVMGDALRGMAQAGWTGETGADADHLKTTEDVDRTVAAGFTFFTIDPSDHVDEKSDGYDEATLRRHFDTVKDQIDWTDTYTGESVTLTNGTAVELDEEALNGFNGYVGLQKNLLDGSATASTARRGFFWTFFWILNGFLSLNGFNGYVGLLLLELLGVFWTSSGACEH